MLKLKDFTYQVAVFAMYVVLIAILLKSAVRLQYILVRPFAQKIQYIAWYNISDVQYLHLILTQYMYVINTLYVCKLPIYIPHQRSHKLCRDLFFVKRNLQKPRSRITVVYTKLEENSQMNRSAC